MIKKIGVLSGVLTATSHRGSRSGARPAPARPARPESRTSNHARPAPAPPGSQTQYTQGAPGYGATNSNGFEQATETTTLVRDTNVFSSSYQPFVTLENSTSSTLTPEVELIPTATSTSTPVDSWYPNGDAGRAPTPRRSSGFSPRPTRPTAPAPAKPTAAAVFTRRDRDADRVLQHQCRQGVHDDRRPRQRGRVPGVPPLQHGHLRRADHGALWRRVAGGLRGPGVHRSETTRKA